MTSIAKLIRLQSGLNDYIGGEYGLRNVRNGTRIITEEIQSYLLPEFRKVYKSSPTFFQNSGRSIKAVIHLPFAYSSETISTTLKGLVLKVVDTRQRGTNRKAPNGQSHIEPLQRFHVVLTRNITFQETLVMNSPNHIIFKVEFYRAQIGVKQCYNCQNFGHVWANCQATLMMFVE
jgi:hypothetical protein